MPKKRAKRKRSAPKGKGAMTGLRGGFKTAVGTGGKKRQKNAWLDWFWWVLLGLAVAFLFVRAMS